MSTRRPPRITVIGPSQATAEQAALAEQVGAEIALRGAILVCGSLGGAFGTLSEIALALRASKPVIGLGTWQMCAPDGSVPPVIAAEFAVDAVAKALGSLRP